MGYPDTTNLYCNLPKESTDVHHNKMEDEPYVNPSYCYRWMLVPIKVKQNMLKSTAGLICKVCLSSTSSWNSTKTMCKKHARIKNQGQGVWKNPTCQLHPPICKDHAAQNLNENNRFRMATINYVSK